MSTVNPKQLLEILSCFCMIFNASVKQYFGPYDIFVTPMIILVFGVCVNYPPYFENAHLLQTKCYLVTVLPKNSWSIRHLSDGLYIFYSNLWDISHDTFRGGWGCEVSCGGHHRPRGKTTTGSALDGAVFDIAQILAYPVHNMSRSQLYLGFGHFGWLPSFFSQ